VRHHGDQPPPRLPPVGVGLLLPDDLGRGDVRRLVRAVLHAVPPLPPVRADGGHRGGEGGAPAGEPPLLRRPRRRPRAGARGRRALPRRDRGQPLTPLLPWASWTPS